MSNNNKRWSSLDSKFTLQISNDLIFKLSCFADDANDIETGGIIVGRYSNDNSKAFITDFIPPATDTIKEKYSIRRGNKGLRNLLKSLWSQNDRVYYVGEWHYHPELLVNPSTVDLDQMKEISNNPSYQCKAPLMVIIGKGKEGLHDIKVMVFPFGEPIQLNVLLD